MTTPLSLWWNRQVARFYYRQGLTCTRRTELKEAIATFDRALPHHPRPDEVLVASGLAHHKLGNLEQAIATYNQALDLNPENARAYGNRGLAQYQLGDEAAALADWDTALAYRSNYADVYYNRALIYLQRQQLDLALDDLDRALAANPHLVEAYFHRGNIREQMGDRPGAVQDWQLAVCNDLAFDQAKNQLVIARDDHRNHRLAVDLQSALDLDDVTLEVQHKGHRVDISLHRRLGAAINYLALSDIIRKHLISLRLGQVEQFQLIGRVGEQSYPEWQQIYKLYDLNSCPPSHWRFALLALLICPPFGVPATFFAAQVKPSYSRGKYQFALRASSTVRGLWVLSRGIMGFVAVVVLIHLGLTGFQEPSEDVRPPHNYSFQERMRS